jgi:hypothetical protein
MTLQTISVLYCTGIQIGAIKEATRDNGTPFYTRNIVIKTASGDISITCHASNYTADDLLLELNP